MEESDSWAQQIDAARDALGARLEARELPRLRQAVGIFRSTYENLYKLFLRKSVIQEDRYRYDAHPKKLASPDDGPMAASDRLDQASSRLSAYHAQLELLASTLQPSLDWLTLQVIRPIADLMQYVRWSHLAEGSESPVTACVADCLKRIKAGNDPLSAQIASTSATQLDHVAREILAILEHAAVYQREAYKAILRRDVLPVTGRDGTDAGKLDRVKKHFATARKGSPFYPELLGEVLAEDSPDGLEARERALIRLAGGGKKETSRAHVSDRESLLQAVHALAAAAQPLADCSTKLAANRLAARREKEPTGLLAIIRRLAPRRQEEPVYKVEYLDGAVMRSETIDLDAFLAEVDRQSRIVAGLGKQNGAAAARIQQASEKTLLDFLDRQLGALHLISRRLTGLSEAFRQQTSAEIRGIKIELTVLKNSLIRSNQLRHEYTAAREREEQAKRLGLEA